MQFFDYDSDLKDFNTLMEDIEDPTPMMEDDDELVIRLEASSTADNGGSGLNGDSIAKAVIHAVNTNPEIRSKLFKSAYWHTDTSSFDLADVDGCKIINDPSINSVVKKLDNGNVAVNLSRLVYKKTPDDYIKSLQGVKDWSQASNVQTKQFDDAVKAAADSLPSIADKQLDSQTNDSTAEEYVDIPDDDNGEVDQRQLYSTILKDFRENYQQELEADCEENKGQIDEEGRQSILDQYYAPLIEPYLDKADDNTQQRIKKIVNFYVVKYTQDSNSKEPNQDNTEYDDMDWSVKEKPQTTADDTDNSNAGNNKPSKDKGYQNWFNNTMQNWGENGVLNTELYKYPTLKGLDKAKSSSKNSRTDKRNRETQRRTKTGAA